MILYCNSDSYGVMSTTKNRYGEFLADKLNARLINNGISGSCNKRIVRNSLRDLIQLKNQTTEKILAVICLGALNRSEWWDLDYVPSDNDTDGHFRSFTIRGVKPTQVHYKHSQEWFKIYNDEAEQTNLFVDLVMLTNWLKSSDIDYIIFAGNTITYQKIAYDDIFIKSFSDIILADQYILNINNFSFATFCIEKGHVPFDYNLYNIHGHHGELAHKEFADFLLEFYNTHI